MVRRLKSELVDWDGKPRFPQRQLDAIEVDYTDEEKQVHAWLQRVHAPAPGADARGRRRNAFATEFVLKLLKKRLFSSPAAFAATLDQHIGDASRRHAGGKAAQPSPTMGILRRADRPDRRGVRRRRGVRGGDRRGGGHGHAGSSASSTPARALAAGPDAAPGPTRPRPSATARPRR